MRSFIAIDFSNALKKQIADLQAELRTYASAGRWKYIGNFHLTLKFLGEIDPGRVEKISGVMHEVLKGKNAFSLKVSGIGSFPGRDSIRVLWLGLGGDLASLGALQEEIDAGLLDLGFKREERGYTPHVTIGQDIVFDRSFDSIKEAFGNLGFSEISVESILLYKSEQVQNRRIYTPVKEFGLLNQ